MQLILRLAGRNIFRNTRRTALTILLIACGLAALLFTDSFVKGMVETMINISTKTFLGHGQVHHMDYRQSQDVDHYIKNTQVIYQVLNNSSDLQAYSPRTISGAMLSSSQNVTAARIYGVKAEQEAQVSLLKSAMIDGIYLSGKSNEVIVGYDLAELLEIKLGDRLVVTVSAAHGGELSQELFRLSGIFKFNDRQMDKHLAFINLEKSQQVLNINGVHEIALRFNDVKASDNNQLALWQDIKQLELEALNWRELVPQLNGILKMTGFSTLIMSLIMFTLVVLGLINSMFMSIYERQQEFGVLLSLGTRPTQIFNQILTEGILIGLISAIFGLILGWGLSFWISIKGIDYGNLEMSGLTINEPIYSIIDGLAFMELALAIFVITTLSCIYPALHAAKLSPSFAMRKVS